ncbi:MAG: hypothetical protein E6J87_09030 [Deltaproteobacteria bacterium]|nr:MAG: hypothetical protein E6J87_09030 [Deltaproteobacteria bacterium]
MAEPEQEQPQLEDGADEEEASSPFDHPAFLPVLLWGLAAWFGYDGWFNPKIESVMFNRYGFGILVVLAIYFSVQSLRETRAREGEGQQPD